jgi:ketosteroid isomerase-like protein
VLDETLRRLFAAENTRDWDAVAQLLHPRVTWILVGDRTSSIEGRDAYLARIEAAYADRPTARFEVARWRGSGRGRILCELVDDEGAVSVEVFDVKNGLVVREWEFLFGTPVP